MLKIKPPPKTRLKNNPLLEEKMKKPKTNLKKMLNKKKSLLKTGEQPINTL
jgi:hypothetical protein